MFLVKKEDWPGQFSALPTSSENSALTLNVDTNITVPTPGLLLRKTENRAEAVAHGRVLAQHAGGPRLEPQHHNINQKTQYITVCIIYVGG